jgi:hypothetical protein
LAVNIKSNNYLAVLITCSILLCTCTSQKKIEYVFPADMKPMAVTAFTEMCDKGQILYNINCAKCHNYKVKRKEYVPDFTKEKLLGYTLRISNPKHKTELRDTIISTESLDLIMKFLTFKKKNEVPKK